jgi:hypothetical protein
MDLGDNMKDEAFVQAIIIKKDTEIHILNKRLKIRETEHVQTPELQVLQAEKEQLLKKMI